MVTIYGAFGSPAASVFPSLLPSDTLNRGGAAAQYLQPKQQPGATAVACNACALPNCRRAAQPPRSTRTASTTDVVVLRTPSVSPISSSSVSSRAVLAARSTAIRSASPLTV